MKSKSNEYHAGPIEGWGPLSDLDTFFLVGESSPDDSEELPPILRKRLPYSASAVKEEFAEAQKVSWIKMWTASPRFARFQHVDTAFPFNKYRKTVIALSRAQSSLLFQLRTGHIPLNSYLHRIKKSVTRRYASCWDAGRGSILVETAPYTTYSSVRHMLGNATTWTGH